MVPLGLYELHCEELVGALVKRTAGICSQLLERMTAQHKELNSQLRQECMKISEKALTTPINTDHLMELKEYVERVEEKDFLVIEQRMMDSMGRLKILMEHSTFPSPEISLNAGLFSWLTRLPKAFADHKEIISESRREAEEALKV